MRAYCVTNCGEAPSIQDIPVPADDSALLIRVTYAGVNPVDYKLVERLTADSPYPFVLGVDFAGVVENVPSENTEFKTGDRIFGMARTHGAYSEYTAVVPGTNAEPIAKIPHNVTDQQAAALPIPAITALGSLDLLGITSGQSLVVIGATGSVGGYAVQMARSKGVNVIGIVRSNSEEAKRLGANEVYNTNDGDPITRVKESYPDGVDAVLDLVSDPDAINRDAEILKNGGSLVSAIYSADEKWFAQHNITAHNIAGNTNPLSTTEGLNKVVALLQDGTITERIRLTDDLENAANVLEKLRHGGLSGKAVLRIHNE
jgi:NADPH:quinone reductase-like Zn-dependent oxidoreductase